MMQARAVRLLTQAASYCDDETRLQRIIPYLMVIFVPCVPSAHQDLRIRLLHLLSVDANAHEEFMPQKKNFN